MNHPEFRTHTQPLAWFVIIGGLAGCVMVGPDYQRPNVNTGQNFKETAIKPISPAGALPGKWWTVFGDAKLNELEEEAWRGSPTLVAAAERVNQARAVARVTDADLLPTVNLDPSAGRARQSENRPVQPGSSAVGFTSNRFRVPLDMAYEIDFWGKIRRGSEAALARLESASAAYRTAALTLSSEVAQNYFAIKTLDAERVLLRDTIELRKQALALIRTRFKGGISSELDVARAETELFTAEAESVGLNKRRAELENALAVLLGRLPAEFTLEDKLLALAPPDVPVGLPAELLQRRPDIIETERTLAARNAEIGVAKAAFFPTIRLTGQFGFESIELKSLLKSPSRIAGIDIAAAIPIFEGGRNKANLARAQAVYDENLANYRQRVLVALQEVDSALAGLRILAEQSEAQARSVNSAKRGSQLSGVRFKSGLVNYLEVIDTERTLLANQRLATQLGGQRLGTTVALIKALGGGWETASTKQGTASPSKAIATALASPKN